AAWVTQAFESLATHDVVLGPAHDGGYYLLGQRLKAAGAPVDLFSGITMSTETVRAETLARAETAGLSVALTPTTFDVDDAQDLDQLRQVLRDAPSDLADAAPATQTILAVLPSLPPYARPQTPSAEGTPLALAGSGEE